jgi:hypothetical protein
MAVLTPTSLVSLTIDLSGATMKADGKLYMANTEYNGTQNIEINLSGSTTVLSTFIVPVKVMPCAITAVPAFAKVEAKAGFSATSVHPVATFTNAESSVTHCGAIEYSLVSPATGLAYDPLTRTLYYTPSAVASLTAL